MIFEPFEVPEGDSVRLTLTGAVGEVKDELIVEIPIHPWGVPVFASASGTSSESTTVFVGLPAGRTYENPDMLIAVSPSLRRMLIELALGRDAHLTREPSQREFHRADLPAAQHDGRPRRRAPGGDLRARTISARPAPPPPRRRSG